MIVNKRETESFEKRDTVYNVFVYLMSINELAKITCHPTHTRMPVCVINIDKMKFCINIIIIITQQ